MTAPRSIYTLLSELDQTKERVIVTAEGGVILEGSLTYDGGTLVQIEYPTSTTLTTLVIDKIVSIRPRVMDS